MLRLRDAPIATKVLALLLASASVLVLACGLFLVAEYFALKQTLQDNLEALTAVIADNTMAAVTFNDPQAAERTLRSLHAVADIEMACLFTTTAEHPNLLFADYRRAQRVCPPHHFADMGAGTLTAHVPVRFAGDAIADLLVVRGLGGLWRLVAAQSVIAVMCLAVGLVLIVALVPLARRLLVTPVFNLAGTVRQVTDTQDYSLRVEALGHDELGQLAASFNMMLETVETHEAALLNANQALEQEVRERTRANEDLRDALERNLALRTALRELETTQAQLVAAEKMASLGSLVAGVAHEINNPVGIGVTAASQLVHEVHELGNAYAAGTLKASTLKTRLANAENMANVTLTHLRRAAELVASFKRVAIDQSSDDCHDFELGEYLNEIMRSLLPQLKKTPHQLSLDVDQQVPMHSNPGAISQVVTNLVINALRHGFPDDHPGGHIRIKAIADASRATITVSDDGVGIPDEYQTEIFEPFFTTQRNRGGSGLGLSVVYNLVAHKLGGRVDVYSQINRGTEFVVIVPLNAPEQ